MKKIFFLNKIWIDCKMVFTDFDNDYERNSFIRDHLKLDVESYASSRFNSILSKKLQSEESFTSRFIGKYKEMLTISHSMTYSIRLGVVSKEAMDFEDYLIRVYNDFIYEFYKLHAHN